MTTGTIIFLVVIVLQAVIRMAAKQGEKKAKEARARLEGAQTSPLEVARITQVKAPPIVAMPNRSAPPVPPVTQGVSAAPAARSYLEEMKRRIDQFAEDAPTDVVAALRRQWSDAAADVNSGFKEERGDTAVVEARGVVPGTTGAFDSSFDAASDEEDPAGEATATYLRERSRQIHEGALRGRHPGGTTSATLSVSPSADVASATSSPLRTALSTKAGLRQGFILAEVLGPPISLRQPA